MDKLTLSVPEAAKLLGVSRDVMYALCRRPDCPFCFRLGQRILIGREQLAAWIANEIGNNAG